MRHKPTDADRQPAQNGKCAHYWVIESPKGPTSRGVCKFCGMETEFRNYMPYPLWEDKPSKSSQLTDSPHSGVSEETGGLLHK